MAGTIVVDRIESDASYTSTINVANRITFSNTVNFGVFAGTAPVAGFYLPTTNNLAFTTASTERMRIDSSGKVGIGTTSPSAPLHVQAITGGLAMRFTGRASPADGYSDIGFFNNANTTQFAGFGVSNAGVYLSAETAIPIIFYTSATERMRIDSSGNVGIGTSSMSNRLEVVQSASADASAAIRAGTNGYAASLKLIANDATGSRYNTLNSFYGSTEQWSIRSGAADSTMTFCTGSSATERMRIDSSGNLLVGTTTNYGTARTSINNSGTVLGLYCSGASGAIGMVIGKQSNDASTSQVLMQFLYNNGSTGLGQINGNGGSQAAFGSYSDIRLKENINNIPPQLHKICALRPVEFDYKDGSGHQTGFIAQEMQEVYPDAVGVGQNEMLTVTGWNKTEAYLVKAIQEQQELITSLTARITALESN